jgi:hypothetical protein
MKTSVRKAAKKCNPKITTPTHHGETLDKAKETEIMV